MLYSHSHFVNQNSAEFNKVLRHVVGSGTISGIHTEHTGEMRVLIKLRLSLNG